MLATRSRGGGASGVVGSGRFRLQKKRGRKGEMISEPRRFQIEEEERRRGHVPRDRRRPEAAELKLDLELGLVWRGLSGVGGDLGE